MGPPIAGGLGFTTHWGKGPHYRQWASLNPKRLAAARAEHHATKVLLKLRYSSIPFSCSVLHAREACALLTQAHCSRLYDCRRLQPATRDRHANTAIFISAPAARGPRPGHAPLDGRPHPQYDRSGRRNGRLDCARSTRHLVHLLLCGCVACALSSQAKPRASSTQFSASQEASNGLRMLPGFAMDRHGRLAFGELGARPGADLNRAYSRHGRQRDHPALGLARRSIQLHVGNFDPERAQEPALPQRQRLPAARCAGPQLLVVSSCPYRQGGARDRRTQADRYCATGERSSIAADTEGGPDGRLRMGSKNGLVAAQRERL